MRAQMYPVARGGLLLAAFLVMGLAACGRPASQPSAAYPQMSKPSAVGTPISGTLPSFITPESGYYESLFSADGVAYIGSANEINAFQTAGGKLLWQHDVGGAFTLDAVANGTIYGVTGTNGSTVVAIHAADGAQLWQHATGGGPIMGLSVASDMVYVSDDGPLTSSSTSGSFASIYALRAADGSQTWRYTADIELPVPIEVAGGTVWARASATRGGPAILDALDPATGQLRWSYRAGDEFADPIVADGVAYIATGSGQLDALAVVSGKLLWQFSVGPERTFAGRGTVPTVVDGVLYVATSDRVYAVRAADGHVLWQADRASTGVPTTDQPVVAGGAIYTKEGDGGLVAFRASDGATLWHQRVSPTVMGFAFDQGYLAVMTQGRAAFGLRASDGTQLWQQPIDNFASWDPNSPAFIVANGVVVVGTERRVIKAMRENDGVVLWQFAIPAKAVPAPGVYSAAVSFDSSADYGQTLQAITDLGLTIGSACIFPGGQWIASGLQDRGFPNLLIVPTPLARLGWLTPLQALPGIHRVQTNPVYHCPLLQSAPPGTPAYLGVDQSGTYARISFTDQTNYEAALLLGMNLGFRLANPCYERLSPGTPVAWSAMGQEAAFAQTHSLVVATTPDNSTTWRQQVRSASDVTGLQVMPAIAC